MNDESAYFYVETIVIVIKYMVDILIKTWRIISYIYELYLFSQSLWRWHN